MGRLIILATVVALAVAKPELYKENENFQYSRSSSDEGTKAGFYGAQRGNMGGNYERAHNMDTLAQHQMGGLVSQVHGELGDASKAKAGNVFAASNSRGMYGSGHYDLSKVQGRNFQDGVSYGDSMSEAQSSAYRHSAASHNFVHTGNTQNYRHQAGQTGQYSISANDADNLYNDNNSRNSDAVAAYYLQSGHQGQKAYEQSSSNQFSASGQDSDVRTRLISARPIRVVVRPGSTVTVPVAAQTYDSTHRHLGSVYDQNSFNSEAEDLNSIDNTKTFVIPSNKAKHYESSYSYQKEWEKHDTKPVAVPLGIQTENPLAKERYISRGLDSESHVNQASDFQAARSSNSHNSYNTKSSQALHQSGYNAQHYGSDAQAYNHGFDLEKANQDALSATMVQTKPSGYQSSYSYHKSWERQGDPYVIKPASYNQQTQRLTDASNSAASISSHHYGLQNRKGYQKNSQIVEDCDCEEDQGHIRMVRSYDPKLTQQSQNLEDLGQQTENLEDLGQQTQGHWDNLDDLGQQTQQWGKFESSGPQNRNQWSQSQNLGQATQNQWDNLGQQTQNQWSNLQDLGQQSQTQWGNLNDLGQQVQNNEDLEQQLQNSWASFDKNTGQQAETNLNNAEQQVQSQWYANTDDAKNINTFQKPESSSIRSINPTIIHNFEIDRHFHKNIDQFNQNSQSQSDVNAQGGHQDFWNYYPQQSSHHNSDNWHTSYHQTSSVYNKHSQKPLNNLWDKINSLDRDSVSIDQNSESPQNSWHNHYFQNGTDNSSKITTEAATTAKINEQNEIQSGWRPVDIGRGDIGSEEVGVIKPTEKINKFNNQQSFDESKKYKTAEEIETLSLTKPSLSSKNHSNNDTPIDESLKVISLSEQSNKGNKYKNINYSEELKTHEVESKTGKIGLLENKNPNREPVRIFENNKNNFNNMHDKSHVKENSAESLFAQQNENFNQQSTWSQNLDKLSTQNMKNEEQLANFGQKADNVYLQSNWIGHTADNGHEQQLMKFGNHQLNSNFKQQSQSTWGETFKTESQENQLQQNINLEQQRQATWGETLASQSQQQHEDQYQQHIQPKQQSQSTWEETLESQSQLKHDDQPHQNIDLEQQSLSTWEESQSQKKHDDTEQQLTDFTQQIENLEQQLQSADQLESFYNHEKVISDQQQQLTDFSQQSEKFNQNVEQETPNKLEQTTDYLHKISTLDNNFGTLARQSSKNPKEVNMKAGTHAEDQHHEVLQQETNALIQKADDLTQQNIQQQNQGTWEDLSQKQQSLWEPQQPTNYKQRLSLHDQKVEELEIPRKFAEVELIPLESTTSKPGFWKSVGSKFVNAKDKVASWFEKN